MMPDFSSVPMAIGTQEAFDTPVGVEELVEFESKGFNDFEAPDFKHIHITFRFTNGDGLMQDYYYAEMLGCGDTPDLETVEGEDCEVEPALSIFNGGVTDACKLKMQPILLRHLFIELCRTMKTLRTELYIARCCYSFGVCGYETDDMEEREAQAFERYPDWLIPLANIGFDGALRGDELHREMVELIKDASHKDQLPLKLSPPVLLFDREKQLITEAVDEIVSAEKDILDDGTGFYNPEEGLFLFLSEDIQHDEDVSEAAHTYLVEMTDSNPLRELVTVVRNKSQLDAAMRYLRAIDNLYELCQKLP